MEWEHLFKSWILDRGYDYYRSNLIKEYNLNLDKINAIVSGTEEYDVEIEIENGKIFKMFCNCPYADAGNNCKHMASVLYKYEDDGINIESMKDKSILKADTVYEIVDNTSEVDVKIFLRNILQSDSKLFGKFKRFANRYREYNDIESIKLAYDDIVDYYSSYDNCIDYGKADDFSNDLMCFVEINIDRLLLDKKYQDVYESIIL